MLKKPKASTQFTFLGIVRLFTMIIFRPKIMFSLWPSTPYPTCWKTPSIFTRNKTFREHRGLFLGFRRYATYRRHFSLNFCVFEMFSFEQNCFPCFKGNRILFFIPVGLMRVVLPIIVQKAFGFYSALCDFFGIVLFGKMVPLGFLQRFWLQKRY